MSSTDKSLPSEIPGVLIPDVRWEDALVWCQSQEKARAEILWAHGAGDPILFLAALAQKIDHALVGLFLSRVFNRPPLMAAKQLMTLYNLTEGRLQLLVDEPGVRAVALEYELEKIGRAESHGLPRLWRPTLLG